MARDSRRQHERNRREASITRRTWILSVTGTVIAALGVAIAFVTYAAPNEPAEKQENGNLSAIWDEITAYYPKQGGLPKARPPTYPPGRNIAHCQEWADWASDVEAASTLPSLMIQTIAGKTSPITILDVEPVVHSRHPVEDNNLIRCQYGAGGYGGTTLYTSLDDPAAAKPMDIDSDGEADTTLPGGRFMVNPQEAEWLTVRLEGATGFVYAFSLRFSVIENGERRVETIGSSDEPLLIAFVDFNLAFDEYDWDFKSQSWVPARYPGPGG